MKRVLAAAVMGVFAAGCASSGTQAPLAAYPAKGQSAEQQARDTSECQAWAKQQSGFDPAVDTAKGAGIGAVIGAVAGAATGAAVGAATGAGAGAGAATGAVIGGVGGAAGGGAYQYSKSREGHERAYSACMQGRGYTVAR